MASTAPASSNPADVSSLSDAEFFRFRDYFHRKTGIFFEPSKRYFVDKRVLQRVQAVGARSFREYFTQLRFQASGEELQQITNLLTVNETYFIREEYQLDCMVKSILNEIVKSKGAHETIRIWSMPCSTGEEPFSIALYLLEHWPMLDQVDVEIYASDIDTQVLEIAQRGIFSARSVQNVPPKMLAKYFRPTSGERYQLIDDVREAVNFSNANITDAQSARHFKDVDLVFCRNLLIYFDDGSRRVAADTIFDALNPNGFVMLGHSESMSRISPLFKAQKFGDVIVYQKPGTREDAK